MTRTQKLGLCTWLPEDPVCLAEVNDNFTRLDASGGRALRLAEAAMVNLGGLMAAQAHAGGHAAYSETISVDAFCDTEYIESYDGVYLRGKKLELLSSGLGNGTVTGGTNVTSGGGDYNASDVHRQINTKKAWTKLFDFQPDAYGTITRLVLKTVSTATTSVSAHVKLSIWDTETDSLLVQTSLGTITHSSGEDSAVGFSLELLVDPNRQYTVKVWIEDMPVAFFVLQTLTFTVSSSVASSGHVLMKPRTVPGSTGRAELLLHTSEAAVASPALAFDAGGFAAMTALGTTPDRLSSGLDCTLRRYSLDLPEGCSSAQLKLELSGSGSCIYDFALIFL